MTIHFKEDHTLILRHFKFLILQELYNKNHKIYHVKPLKVLTPDEIHKLKQKENLIHRTHIEPGGVSALSVHFGNGIFTEIDRCSNFVI